MKSSFKFLVLSTLVLVVLFASGNMIPNVAGAAPTIGWDTISVTVVNGTLTLNPGGSDTRWRTTTRQFRSVALVPSAVELHQPVVAPGRRPVLPARRAVRLQ